MSDVIVCDHDNFKWFTFLHYRRKGLEPPSKKNNVKYEAIYHDGIPVFYHCDQKGRETISVKEFERRLSQ